MIVARMQNLPSSEILSFRELVASDADDFFSWLTDYEVVKYSLSSFLKLKTKADVEVWLADVIADQSVLSLAVVRKESNKLIGYAGISSISKTNQSGEYYILIGDKKSWNHGYGTEVTKCIVEYGFSVMKLHRIQLTVSDHNIGAVKAYEKAGFVREGVLRDAAFRDGKFHNKIVMSVINPKSF